jgi:undecaprenyl diphosphate synthase
MQPTLNIGLIPDGTRRWAKRENLLLSDAYRKTMLNICEIVDYLYSHNSLTISIYLLSKQNLGRKADELDAVVNAEIDLIENLLPFLLDKWNVNLVIAGCLEKVPITLSKAASDTSSIFCQKVHSRKLYLLIGYDSYDEITHVNKMADTTSNWFDKLWVPHKLDLVIRTSGENRLSNFLPLQTSYAELFFVDCYFNDFNLQDLKCILDGYTIRNRRFGH